MQVRAGHASRGLARGVQTAVPRTLARLRSARLCPERPSSGDTKVRPPKDLVLTSSPLKAPSQNTVNVLRHGGSGPQRENFGNAVQPQL